MINIGDFLHLGYTQDLTRAGIAYAARSLSFTYDRMGGSPFDRLRRIVAGKAVELAFRRCLDASQVPYDLRGDTPFTDPDRYDVAIGGRRCDIKSFSILTKDKISHIRREPSILLVAPALVPDDQLAAEHLSEDDIYIFAFLTALVTQDSAELHKALAARQPVYPVYPLPEAWAHPSHWGPLAPLSFKLEREPEINIEIGGQVGDRSFQQEELHLTPGELTTSGQDFYSLAYLHAGEIPKGRLGLHSPRMHEAFIIQPHEWGNIWVYGMEVIIAGFMTRREFRRRARPLLPGSHIFQYARTRTPNHALPMADLYPIDDLFEEAKRFNN